MFTRDSFLRMFVENVIGWAIVTLWLIYGPQCLAILRIAIRGY